MSEIIGRSQVRPVIDASVDTRATFITRVYGHLFGAIVGFTAIEVALFKSGLAERLLQTVAGSRMGWLLFMGAFMVVGWFASRAAHRSVSRQAQYLGLAVYVALEAVIFAPILLIAHYQGLARGSNIIQSAALVTIAGFAVLSAVVFITRKDFSFLRGALMWGFGCALILMVAGLIFGFGLGTWFSMIMIALAGAAVLYDTSNVLHHFPEDRYVGAALELFASIAVMFWYVLRLFLDRR